MSVRSLLTAAVTALVAALVGVVVLAAPAAADDIVGPSSPGAYVLTPGRAWSLVAAGFGLASVVVGAVALVRRTDRGRTRAVVSLVAGLGGAVIGGLVVAAADGGPGTGYGIVGGAMALVISVVGLVLGGCALARARRLA